MGPNGLGRSPRHRLGPAGRLDRRKRMAARADVAIVAIRRPTGTFSGAGAGAAGGAGPAGGADDGESAVGASVTSATAGAAAGAAAGDPASGRAAYGQAAAADAAGAAGGLGWDPLCQVRARITWVGES